MISMPLEALLDRYLYMDPAGAKRDQLKRVRARAAMVCCGVDHLGRVLVLETWADRAGTFEMVDKFLDMCERWQPKVAGYEEAAQQSLLIDPIFERAARRNLFVPLAAVKPSTSVDKNFRIRAILQRVIKTGRLIMHEHMYELRSELAAFPMSPLKDLVDALAGCVYLIPPVVNASREQEEAQALGAYLRETGVPPGDILRRVRAITGRNDDPEESFYGKLYNIQRLAHH